MRTRLAEDAYDGRGRMITAQWLALRRIAHADASSEHPDHPLASLWAPDSRSGWRAAQGGEQWIRIRFREPRHVSRIRLVFVEETHERTQQFTLWWASRRGETHREVLRQQFNFSPAGATCEVEEYAVDLANVSELEIRIVPDISGRPIPATLAECRIA